MNQKTKSQQVSWLEVHDFVTPKLEQVKSWPMVGTPEWCELDNRSKVKWAALLDAAQHWALRIETCQTAMTAASHDISEAADWGIVAQNIVRRSGVYITREVA